MISWINEWERLRRTTTEKKLVAVNVFKITSLWSKLSFVFAIIRACHRNCQPEKKQFDKVNFIIDIFGPSVGFIGRLSKVLVHFLKRNMLL